MDNAEILGVLLTKRKLSISVAESCTGGLISKLITDISGSSAYFYCGFVTYSNDAKTIVLNVSPDIIGQFGAVSYETAEAMVRGLKALTNTDICVSTTGIAGPGGGSPDKPVGLVYTAFLIREKLFLNRLLFKGDRNSIRLQTANYCIKFLIEQLKDE